MHKYLKDIGINIQKDALINFKTKKNKKYFKKQREKYGFDSREIWNLDVTSCYWVYEHLKMFYDICNDEIDMSYHKFNIPILIDYDLSEQSPVYKTQNHTLEECVVLAIAYLEKYLVYDETIAFKENMVDQELIPVFKKKKNKVKVKFEKNDKDIQELINDNKCCYYNNCINVSRAQTAFEIYAKILPALWW